MGANVERDEAGKRQVPGDAHVLTPGTVILGVCFLADAVVLSSLRCGVFLDYQWVINGIICAFVSGGRGQCDREKATRPRVRGRSDSAPSHGAPRAAEAGRDVDRSGGGGSRGRSHRHTGAQTHRYTDT